MSHCSVLQCVAICCSVSQCVSHIWHDPFTNVTWLCDMAHLYVRHELFVRSPSRCLRRVQKWFRPSPKMVWMSHVLRMNESCCTCDMTISPMRHDFATWLIYMCDTTHAYMHHDSSGWSPSLRCSLRQRLKRCEWVMSLIWHDHFTTMTWLCDKAHLQVRHDWLICATWHIDVQHCMSMCHVAFLSGPVQNVVNESSSHLTHVCESYCTYARAMSHIWISQATLSHISMNHVAHMNEHVEYLNEPCCRGMSHMCMMHVLHINEPYRDYEWVMPHTCWPSLSPGPSEE